MIMLFAWECCILIGCKFSGNLISWVLTHSAEVTAKTRIKTLKQFPPNSAEDGEKVSLWREASMPDRDALLY